MPGATPNRGYPYPTNGDPVDVAGDILDLAVAIDGDIDGFWDRRIRADSETAPDVPGPTVGATPLNIDTISIPVMGVPGHVVAWGGSTWSKTVVTDIFQIQLFIGATPVHAFRDLNPSAGSPSVGHGLCIGGLAIAGTSSVPIVLQLERVLGTGTATAASGTWSSLGYIFIPT